MADAVVGLLHPGEMGAALGSVLTERAKDVLWASSGRSPATADRAEGAALRDVGTVDRLAGESNVVMSVCPPHAAADVAQSVSGFEGVFVDANAVSPATARTIAAVIEQAGGHFVDGGIVGPPPRGGARTRLYLSGPSAGLVADLFVGTAVEARIVSEEIGAASAVKMAYAAWTKGTAALLLAIRALARAEEVEPALLEEWGDSLPELPELSRRAARSAGGKGWRWVGEMEEIASTFASAGLPDGFHQAAAEIFRRSPNLEGRDADEQTLDRVLAAVRATEALRRAP
jgi:3-hydroxyisobutyrate dehydrogenase-like beta-hydroxyacid dehydrogenase